MYCQTWMLLKGIDGTMILYHASCEEDPDLPWPAVMKQDLMDGEKEHSLYRGKTGHSTWSTSAETHWNRCHLVPVKTGLDDTSHANTSLQCFDLDKHGAGMHYHKHTETVCLPINRQGCHWCIYFAQFCITQCWRYSPTNSWSQWESGDHSWLWKILASFSPAADSCEGEMVLIKNLFELLHSTCRDHLFSSLLWQLEQHCTSWKLLPTQCYWEREGYSYGSKWKAHRNLLRVLQEDAQQGRHSIANTGPTTGYQHATEGLEGKSCS